MDSAARTGDKGDIVDNVNVSVEGQTVIALPRTFSTGSTGYQASGKLVLDGRRYQATILLVEIGSKPAVPTSKAK